MATQKQITESMIRQLRTLDPSISAEVGTPENRIIQTVAQAMAEAQVDLNVLNGAWDIQAKFSKDLDRMLGILGFGRQQGTRAKGYVTFYRETATQNPIVISTNTTVFTPTGGQGGISVIFRTTSPVTLEAGETEVTAPIEAIQSGTIGNVAAGVITETLGTPVYGITSVSNQYPTSGGIEVESDSELKARFTSAGAFRNLAGTRDQYMSIALSTVSKKANVVGPISTYKEYIQVPVVSDAEDNGRGAAQTPTFTTALSSNANSKHIYDNVPHFVVNDSGLSPVYYIDGSDYVLNITPEEKNKGDAARYSTVIDPTSYEAPTVYQPNVTFTNVYTGSEANKPETAISPGDVLLFEHSYMSSASRNDYERNVLNCVDVFVGGQDAKVASSVIPRPGNEVPTIYFTRDPESAHYVDKYRRVNEPGHRPIVGNVFTPLYNQPIIDLPDTISLRDGTFTKGVHYWLVEEVTDLYGTVRARNGIEWATASGSNIRSQAAADAFTGPYSGPYITDTSSSVTTLSTNVPLSANVSSQTETRSYIVSNRARDNNSTVLTLTTPPDLNIGDEIKVSGTELTAESGTVVITAVDVPAKTVTYAAISDASEFTVSKKAAASNTATLTLDQNDPGIVVGDYIKITGVDAEGDVTFNDTSAIVTGVSGTHDNKIEYAVTGNDTFAEDDAEDGAKITLIQFSRSIGTPTEAEGKVELTTIGASSKSSIRMTSKDGFPTNGYILVGSEVIKYSQIKTVTVGPTTYYDFVISSRGLYGTKKAKIVLGKSTSANVLIELANITNIPTKDYLQIGSEQIYYQKTQSSATNLVQVLERAANNSYLGLHSVGDVVKVLLTTVDQIVTVENYQYDDNIMVLQSALETNKQVTTDVLGHRAKVRYFKPDVTIMYSQGVNKSTVNQNIYAALKNYFDAVYFGNEIQLSDIIQTIHNVAGVDNVRWSRDILDENYKDFDSSGSARSRLIEANQYGDPITQPILDLMYMGDGTYPTKYQMYLPTAIAVDGDTLLTPSGLQGEEVDNGSGEFASATDYYYTITAFNENGETTASESVGPISVTSTSGKAVSLIWTEVDGADGYKVYRNTDNDFTSGSLLLESVYDATNFVDYGDETMIGLPPAINGAVIETSDNAGFNNFQIQYDKNEPITIQFDDFIIRNYDNGATYSKNDIVLYGENYYRSLQDDNVNNLPSLASNEYWVLDSVNQIAFQAKINSSGNVVTVSSNNLTIGPSFDNPITIEYLDKSSKADLAVVNPIANDGAGVFNNDFQIGDNELAALPIGKNDSAGGLIMSSVITIRAKAQNTWNNLS